MIKNKKETYSNPVSFSDGKKHTNPDPFILRWCGKYYCYATDEFGVKVSISSDLVNWDAKGYVIKEECRHHYWAPSVLYKNGVFYMYYSNIPIEEPDCHHQQLKLAKSDNPEGPFVWEKTFFDKFSIDSHPVQWNGELYMLYSVNDWYGTEEQVAGTCILLDKMKSPEELEGQPKLVVVPSLKQEIYAANRFDDGRDWYTIEGACHVVHGNKCWMLYSANAYENVDYFVGTAVAENKECFYDMEWKKYPDENTWVPLLKKNDKVEGTGHNTVTKAPNLVDDWIVYHGRDAEDELVFGTEQRVMRIDPLYYNGSHMFCFGPTAGECEAPEKPQVMVCNRGIEMPLFLAGNQDYGKMEFWISAEKNHTGVRYGIYLEYVDEKNYLELQFYSGRSKVLIYRMHEGIRRLFTEAVLPSEFEYSVPHCFLVEKAFHEYNIYLDENKIIGFTDPYTYPESKIGIVPYFSKIRLHSFIMTKHVMLTGIGLQDLGRFYQLGVAELKENGLLVLKEQEIQNQCQDENYTEEILFETVLSDNYLAIMKNEEKVKCIEDAAGQFSLWHRVKHKEETFILHGEAFEMQLNRESCTKLCLSGLGILHYSYTKN